MNYYSSNWRTTGAAGDGVPVLSTMGKIFIVVFFLVIFEGALRKWVSADLTALLVLLRDGLAIYGIFWSIAHGKLNANQLGAQVLGLWSVIVVIWGLIQLMVNQSSVIIFIIGLRFWLLYLWFAGAASVSLTKYDFESFIGIIRKLVICLMPLIVLQFYSSPSDFINRQVDGDEDKVFRLTADFVRTTGTFSFTAGQTTLLAMLGPFVLAGLTSDNKFLDRKWAAIAVFLAYAVMVMLSGSRAALITFVLQFVLYLMLEIIFLGQKNKSQILMMLVLVAATVFVLPLVFDAAIDATAERILDANDSEVLSVRIFTIFFGDPELYSNFSWMGYGVGAGTNFVGSISGANFALGETETSRTMLEGGLLGFLFVGVKIIFIFAGLWYSALSIKLNGNILPFLIWVTIAIALFTWSIIGQLTVNSLGFLLLGIGVASLRIQGDV